MREDIFGAGVIGHYLSSASRSPGWQVDLCDIDPAGDGKRDEPSRLALPVQTVVMTA